MSRIFFTLLAAVALLLTSAHANAGEDFKLTSKTAQQQLDDGTLRLTSNKNALIRLKEDAASVVVNNPVHASVMLDTPRLLIVIPHQPGTTSFTVLNAAGDVIMQKDIIVSNVKPKYVRIRRMCAAGNRDCVPNAYYYCPDGCYEVTPVDQGDGRAPPPPLRRSVSNEDTNQEAVVLDQN